MIKDKMNMMITSGYNFEGYDIKDYLGLCSGEVVLGTGFLSSFSAGIADIVGGTSSLYEGKLNQAKELAMQELYDNAKSLGANAIIGVDLDYEVFSADIMAVIANGTAVCIKESATASKRFRKIEVNNYSNELDIHPFFLEVNVDGFARVALFNYGKRVDVINVDIIFTTMFNEKIIYNDLNFINFENVDNYVVSEYEKIEIDSNKYKIINNVSVHIKKYISKDKIFYSQYKDVYIENDIKDLRHKFGADVVAEFTEDEKNWTCLCGKINPNSVNVCSVCKRNKNVFSDSRSDSLFDVLSSFDNVKEMYEYIKEVNDKDGGDISTEIVEIIKKSFGHEKMYGNYKEGCLEKLKEFYCKR